MSGFILHPPEPPAEGMVRQKTLFPITNKFAISDADSPAILECYNFVIMPPAVPQWTHFRIGNNFRASMKYAFSNYPTVTWFGGSLGNLTIGPHSMQYLQETHSPEPYGASGFDSVYYGIGYYPANLYDERKVSIPPVMPPVKTIATQSWQSPNVGTIWRPDPDVPSFVMVGDGWVSSEGFSDGALIDHTQWGTDYVMWVYDWEWMLDGELRRFDPLDAMPEAEWDWGFNFVGITDDLFTPSFPGHRSARVISRKFWNAPWLRYPHLA